MAENNLLAQIQELLKIKGIRAFRNNTGRRGRVSYGLCPGSSDLIGWTKDGRFLAIEVKDGDADTDPERLKLQLAFLADVNSAGGVGILARRLEDVLGL